LDCSGASRWEDCSLGFKTRETARRKNHGDEGERTDSTSEGKNADGNGHLGPRVLRFRFHFSAQCFVEDNRNCGRQVQATHLWSGGKSNGVGIGGFEDGPWQPCCLAAENENVAGGQITIPDRLFREPTKIPVSLPWGLFLRIIQRIFRKALSQVAPRGNVFPMKVLPVVKSCASYSFFVDLKRSRLNNPQLRSRGDARTTNITRILRDLRLMQYNVSQRLPVAWLQQSGLRGKTVV
jgi:hypothetical protein